MNRIIAWFVNNPVAANLLMLVLIVGGALSLPSIHQEEFPSIDTGMVRISVAYLGAAPEEVEQGVCIRIEEALEGATGIDRISSLAVEGACVVTAELETDAEYAAVVEEIKNRVDAVDTLPVETEKPIVSRVIITNGVIQVAVVGDADERTLRVLGQQVRDEIAAREDVSQVSLVFARPYEISIEISEEMLRRHELSFDQVAQAVRQSSLDMPGGSVKTRGGEILLRTKGQVYSGSEFEDIVVLTRPDGTRVTIGEVASVIDGFEDADLGARFDGKPAVIVNVKRVGDEDIRAIAESVLAYVAEAQPRMPEGISLVAFNDQSKDLEARLSALLWNAGGGMILVLLILGLFLRFRLAMWVAAGVPIAFLGALALFPAAGLSISTLSVMAFILVLGIVVDDAIVIGESVHTHELHSENQIEAAINGTREVYVPVIFGVMTTVAAFLPLVLVSSRMGQFFAVIGETAILCLLFSLLESQLILPAHLAHRRTRSKSDKPNPVVRVWTAVQSRTAGWLDRLGSVHYARALERVIEWRYVSVAVAVGIILLTLALFASGRMRYQFLPAVEGDVVYATLTMPQGSPVEVTLDAILQLEEAADLLESELAVEEGVSVIQYRLSTLGKHQGRDGPPDVRISAGGSHLAEVSIELLSGDQRKQSAEAIAHRWRELAGPVPGAVQLVYSAAAFHAGDPVNIELKGGSVETLSIVAGEVKTLLAGYDGVSDIADSFRGGKREVRLSILPEAKPLGLTLDDLARQVRQAFYGLEVQRIQRGRDDVRVMLRYPLDERSSLGFLEEMRIRAADGTEVPFASVARAEMGRGYATIRRRDRQRVLNVTAEVDRSVVTPESVLAKVKAQLPAIIGRYPGVNFSLEGEQRAHGDAMAGLVKGFALALLLIYALLAIPLKSYLQPLVIMSVIPFGTVGAVLGHLIMGWDIVFFSVLGMVALAGVVVNASLVLVHYVNRRRDTGLEFLDAVHQAGVARFRPIVLTSVTTYVGLMPLMVESNLQARMLIPMAISLGYGVMFSSVITLFLVPCLYVILEDVAGSRARGPAIADSQPPLRAGAAKSGVI